jgi:hypothetical protein
VSSGYSMMSFGRRPEVLRRVFGAELADDAYRGVDVRVCRARVAAELADAL